MTYIPPKCYLKYGNKLKLICQLLLKREQNSAKMINCKIMIKNVITYVFQEYKTIAFCEPMYEADLLQICEGWE